MEGLRQTIQTEKIILDEGKKESIESLRYSTDTVLRDNNIKQIIGRIFGGIFGITILFSSITNVITDFKLKKRSPWIYSRIILDFTASGTLIGYTINHTIPGLFIGLGVGITTLIAEIITKNKS